MPLPPTRRPGPWRLNTSFCCGAPVFLGDPELGSMTDYRHFCRACRERCQIAVAYYPPAQVTEAYANPKNARQILIPIDRPVTPLRPVATPRNSKTAATKAALPALPKLPPHPENPPTATNRPQEPTGNWKKKRASGKRGTDAQQSLF